MSIAVVSITRGTTTTVLELVTSTWSTRTPGQSLYVELDVKAQYRSSMSYARHRVSMQTKQKTVKWSQEDTWLLHKHRVSVQGTQHSKVVPEHQVLFVLETTLSKSTDYQPRIIRMFAVPIVWYLLWSIIWQNFWEAQVAFHSRSNFGHQSCLESLRDIAEWWLGSLSL